MNVKESSRSKNIEMKWSKCDNNTSWHKPSCANSRLLLEDLGRPIELGGYRVIFDWLFGSVASVYWPPPTREEIVRTTELNLSYWRDLDTVEKAWVRIYIESIIYKPGVMIKCHENMYR